LPAPALDRFVGFASSMTYYRSTYVDFLLLTYRAVCSRVSPDLRIRGILTEAACAASPNAKAPRREFVVPAVDAEEPIDGFDPVPSRPLRRAGPMPAARRPHVSSLPLLLIAGPPAAPDRMPTQRPDRA